jgi:thymidine kinase
VVETASEIPSLVAPETEVVGIDEGQFFDATLVGVADELANRGLRVIVAGLDQDYRGRPFEPMPQLMAVAEYVDKTLAVCMRCGAPANRSQRLVHKAGRVVVGGAGEYEARCRACFDPNGDEAK